MSHSAPNALRGYARNVCGRLIRRHAVVRSGPFWAAGVGDHQQQLGIPAATSGESPVRHPPAAGIRVNDSAEGETDACT
jgi:hypothetical protein